MLNVEMLSTGDEVLHGQIVDTNAAWLADFFFNQGLPLTRRNTVGDNLNDLVAVLRERSEHADILIVNGGLGPTSDDLSALAAATAKGEGLVLHEAWLTEHTDIRWLDPSAMPQLNWAPVDRTAVGIIAGMRFLTQTTSGTSEEPSRS